LRAVSKVLATANLRVDSFESVLDRAVSGDIVYCDPPYIPIDETSDFTEYSPGGFGPKKQDKLALLFCDLDRKDVRVVLSNSDCPRVRQLYKGFRFTQVQARRSINSNVTGRGKVPELVIQNF
jgi:DNA adenine methylase